MPQHRMKSYHTAWQGAARGSGLIPAHTTVIAGPCCAGLVVGSHSGLRRGSAAALVPAHSRLSPSRLKALDTVVIYAETSRPWMMAAYACWRQGFTVGTIYATLGEEGALFGINQSKCKAVVRLPCWKAASW